MSTGTNGSTCGVGKTQDRQGRTQESRMEIGEETSRADVLNKPKAKSEQRTIFHCTSCSLME